MSWVEAQSPGMDGVNIITSDFVELTDFANIVIKLNNLLLSEQGRKPRWHAFTQQDKCALVEFGRQMSYSSTNIGQYFLTNAGVRGIGF